MSTVTPAQLADGLRALGLPEGSHVLVHTSLRSFGHFEGGAAGIVDAVATAVGPAGTALFPTFTGSSRLGPEQPPHFDVRQSACWTGAVPEAARLHPDAIRSLHPTHSVAAIGADAAAVTRGHELSPTPCGADTPFGRLAHDPGGYVAFLGVTLTCNTMFHHVEEVAKLPYHMQPDPVTATIVDADGRTRQVRLWLHHYGPGRDYPKAEAPLREHGVLRSAAVGPATVLLVQAKPMVEFALEMVAKDPEYLLA